MIAIGEIPLSEKQQTAEICRAVFAQIRKKVNLPAHRAGLL